MRKFFIICCFIFFGNIYNLFSLDIQYTWTLFELGVEFNNTIEDTNLKYNTNLKINALKFNWVEVYTGLGINISLFNYHHNFENIGDGKMFFLFPPTELVWNPFVKKAKMGYITSGIYNKVEWGGLISVPIKTLGFVDTIGIRIFHSRLPLGRLEEDRFDPSDKRYLNWYSSCFFEYSTDKTFRVGLLFAI